jgi:hypothetical protein
MTSHFPRLIHERYTTNQPFSAEFSKSQTSRERENKRRREESGPITN